VQHGVVLERRGDGVPDAEPLDAASQGRVVGFRTAGGEKQFGRRRVEQAATLLRAFSTADRTSRPCV
jgi:hypothetical protein